jgi:hypothetical protein
MLEHLSDPVPPVVDPRMLQMGHSIQPSRRDLTVALTGSANTATELIFLVEKMDSGAYVVKVVKGEDHRDAEDFCHAW